MAVDIDFFVDDEGLPLIGVMPYREIPSFKDFNNTPVALDLLPFKEAFETKYDSDAHFFCYRVEGAPPEHTFRIDKCFGYSKIREKGHEIYLTTVALDMDTPGHERVNEDWLNEVGQELKTAYEDGCSLAAEWTCFYVSRGGIRLVYALQEPVPVLAGEVLISRVLDRFEEYGLQFDRKCKEWNRIFRLPKVHRDGENLWEMDLFEMHFQDSKLDPHDFLDPDKDYSEYEEYADYSPVNTDMPSKDEAREYLWQVKDGKNVRSEWYQKTKNWLQGRECYDCIYKDAPIAEEGSRNNTIISYTGQIVSLLHHREGASPEACYALLVDAIDKLDPDPHAGKSWEEVAWHGITQAWAKEDAKKKQEVEEKKENLDNLTQSMVKGIKKWCEESIVQNGTEAEITQWFHDKSIIRAPDGYLHIMTPSGYYSNKGVPDNALLETIRQYDMEPYINIYKETERGRSLRTVREIRAKRCMGVRDAHGLPCIPGSRVRKISKKQHSILEIPLYQQNSDLKPVYDEGVDTWLRLFCKKEPKYLDKFLAWLCWAPAFGVPLCALSINGPKDIGKTVLCQMLAELCEDDTFTSGQSLCSKFQEDLMNSPILKVDEGFGKITPNYRPDIQFRALVSGDPIKVNRKYRKPMQITNPVRMIMTANDKEHIHDLFMNKHMDPAKKEATAIRLLHINVGPEPAQYLASRGGPDYVGNPKHRWIKGLDGEPSGLVGANHIFWMYKNMRDKYPREGKLAVMGPTTSELMKEVALSAGEAPVILEALAKMFNSRCPTGLAIEDGKAFVTSQTVVDKVRDLEIHSNSLNTLEAADVLKHISKGHGSIGTSKQLLTGQRMKARWWELDLGLLSEECEQHGWDNSNIEAIRHGENPYVEVLDPNNSSPKPDPSKLLDRFRNLN